MSEDVKNEETQDVAENATEQQPKSQQEIMEEEAKKGEQELLDYGFTKEQLTHSTKVMDALNGRKEAGLPICEAKTMLSAIEWINQFDLTEDQLKLMVLAANSKANYFANNYQELQNVMQAMMSVAGGPGNKPQQGTPEKGE